MIATFTIPKVLTASQNGQRKAIAKEAAATISGAYEAYMLANGQYLAPAFKIRDLTPYINYVSIITNNSTIDGAPTDGCLACTTSAPCIKLATGAWLYFWNSSICGTGTGPVDMIGSITVDPDGTCTTATPALGV
ncbi:MAG: hypothetical protein JNK33_06600 [Candidatus Doudnabacteria bacterium]|nr:hypothetical protein [Candidatus Doudnabacteria bacterium]